MAKKKQNIDDQENENPWVEQAAKKLVSKNSLNEIKLNKKQIQLIELIDKNDITIITGPAGTSKTFISCYYAIKCLKEHKFNKIIFTKPIQESGEKLGFLPGSVDDKIDPFYESYRQNISKLIDKTTIIRNYDRGVFEDKPLAYMRGTTYDGLMILDEAQNCDLRSLILFITRLGVGSKMIISGDISQHDIGSRFVSLPFLEEMINDIPGVGIFRFDEEDIMRSNILKEITRRYEKAKSDGTVPSNKK